MVAVHFQHVVQRTRWAVEILALGEADIKRRLHVAWCQQLSLAWLALGSVPRDQVIGDLHERFEKIVHALTCKPRSGFGSTLDATLHRMQRRTAAKIAREIWTVHRGLEEGLWKLRS
jgi:hypothetical protein